MKTQEIIDEVMEEAVRKLKENERIGGSGNYHSQHFHGSIGKPIIHDIYGKKPKCRKGNIGIKKAREIIKEAIELAIEKAESNPFTKEEIELIKISIKSCADQDFTYGYIEEANKEKALLKKLETIE
jgi:AMMECR1 domain-containing protein